MNFYTYQNAFVSTAPPLDIQNPREGRMTFIELPANQIVLDPLIIRKTMQALKEGILRWPHSGQPKANRSAHQS